MDLTRPLSSVIPSLESEVLRVLAPVEAELSGSAIARLVGRGSRAGVRLALTRLEQQGLIDARTVAPAVVYSGNRDHLLWPAIEAMVRAAADVHRELADRIRATLSSALGGGVDASLALYGSVARGESTPESDIDLLLVAPDDVPTASVEEFVDELYRLVPRWTGNACSVYSLTDGDLRALGPQADPMLESWAADARTLAGPELHERASFREALEGARRIADAIDHTGRDPAAGRRSGGAPPRR